MILPSHWAKHTGWQGGNSSTRSVGWTSATHTPCELHSILCINPYNWTFPNRNISFIMDQSTNKTTNKWLLQVACGKTCPTLGALLFAWQKNIVWIVRKARTDMLLADLVCFEVRCLPQSAKFWHFDDVIFKSPKNSQQLLLVCLLLCFLLLLLLSIFLAFDEDNFLSKALVFHCFLVLRCIGEYISLVLFCQFCHLTSSCSFIPQKKPTYLLTYLLLRKRMFSFIFMKSHG